MNPITRSPFAYELGLELVEEAAGKAVVAVELTQRLRNFRGVAHGGLTATLLDMAMGLACRSPAREWTSEGTVTLNIQFMLPGRGRLVAEGRLLKAGNTVAFTEGEVRNENGDMVAKATATFKIVRHSAADGAKPSSASRPQRPAIEEGDSGGADSG
jgi:uncharacterized protein (TIGR00369 family)